MLIADNIPPTEANHSIESGDIADGLDSVEGILNGRTTTVEATPLGRFLSLNIYSGSNSLMNKLFQNQAVC